MVVAGAAPVVANALNGQMRTRAPLAANDERAALKALFDAATTDGPQSRRQFTSARLDDMGTDSFQGPAVARLQTIR